MKSPVLLCAVSGWSDAGSAASGALRYLLMKRPNRRIASLDPDAIYSYTVTRPVTSFASPGRRVLRWPEMNFFHLPISDAPHDLVLLLGPEPDLRWREAVEVISSYAVQMGIERAFTLGAFYALVHFTGPAPVVGLGTNPELQERLHSLGVRDSDYEGSTGFVTCVLNALAERGVPAASLWVAAPSYLPNVINPRLSAVLLGIVEKVLHQDLWLRELQAAGRDAERRIAEALKSRPELTQLLQQISGLPAVPPSESPAERPAGESTEGTMPELPSAEEVVKDLEEYLRRLRQGDQGEGPDRAG